MGSVEQSDAFLPVPGANLTLLLITSTSPSPNSLKLGGKLLGDGKVVSLPNPSKKENLFELKSNKIQS